MNSLYSGTNHDKAFEIANAHGLKVVSMKMGRGAKSWTVYHVWKEK